MKTGWYLVSCFYSKHTQVLAGNGETEQALVYIKKADQLDPNNKVSLKWLILVLERCLQANLLMPVSICYGWYFSVKTHSGPTLVTGWISSWLSRVQILDHVCKWPTGLPLASWGYGFHLYYLTPFRQSVENLIDSNSYWHRKNGVKELCTSECWLIWLVRKETRKINER